MSCIKQTAILPLDYKKKYHIYLYLLQYRRRKITKIKVRYSKTLKLSVVHYNFSTCQDTDLNIGVATMGTHHHLTFSPLQALTNHSTVPFRPCHPFSLSNIIWFRCRKVHSFPFIHWITIGFLFTLKIVGSPRAAVNVATNEKVIIFSTLYNIESTPPNGQQSRHQ